MSPDQIVAFVLALIGPAPVEPLFPFIAAGGVDPRYPVVMATCPKPLAPFEIEGHTVVCGKVNVPENHNNPDGRRIDLTFMLFKSRSLAPAPDAVVHLHGGPGGGIVREVGLTSIFFDQMRARRDIVAFDQRGVDASAGPDSRCYGALANDTETLLQAVRGDGKIAVLSRKLARDCLAEIKASGADISMINTVQNAHDVSAIMHTLGYPTYNIYGASYGTKLGQEVMRSAPEGLRAVVLDSVWPVQVPFYDTMALPHAEALQSLFDQCKADAKCAAAYPNLRSRFWTLWSKLDAQPLQSPTGNITSDALVDLIDRRNTMKLTQVVSTPYLPKMIVELEQGKTQTYDGIVSGGLIKKPTPEAALAGLSGLNADTQAFAEMALLLAQIGKVEEQAVKTALTRLELARGVMARKTGLVDTFEAALSDAARALSDHRAKVAFAADYLRLRAAAPSAAALSALLTRHFEGQALAQLQSLSQMMIAAQVEQVYTRIGSDNAALDRVLLSNFQNQMFSCQEDMDINGATTIPDVSVRLQQNFDWPVKMTAVYEDYMVENFYAVCDEFEKHARPGSHDPITSPIPTLVLQGALDTQTAPSWGELMASTLPNGQLAFFPESGHGTLIFSQCSRDISAAFLDNPTATIDTSCTKTLMPSFVLPDGSRSR